MNKEHCFPGALTDAGLHFALSGRYKKQEIEATDFQEQKDITGHERLVAFSSDLASFSALS